MAAWLSDMALIYFVYGAAFIFLGVSILRQPKLTEDCRLGQFMWLLALFGLLHGLNEWLDFLRVVRGVDPLLDAARALVLPVSFIPLLEFGRRLIRPWFGRLASPWLLVVPVAFVLTVLLGSGLSVEHTLVTSRYVLALPGGILTGVGLLLYGSRDETWMRSGRIRIMLMATGVAFICYAFLAGLIVPPLDAPMARTLNTQWFQEEIGLPVQLFRAICAVIAGVTTWQVLGAFELERERRLHALAIQTSQRSREMELILDATLEGIVGLNGDGCVTFCNVAAADMLGYSREELHGRNLHELIHITSDGALHPADFCGICRLLRAGGRYVSSDETFRRKDGGRVPVDLSGVALLDSWGKPSGAVLSFRDITTRLANEAQLRLRNRALEATHEGIMITDAMRQENPVVYVNHGFTSITGYSLEETIGRNPAFLQGNEREQPGIVRLRRILKGGEAGVVTLHNYRKDGSPFWNELHLAPVADVVGNITHYVGVINDISDRIAYEKELERRAHYDELTGLANRVLLKARLDHVIAQARRHDGLAAVLFIDVDQFKLINDGLGHTCGDHLLVEAAQRLRAVVRESDTVARLGGDEFVVILTAPEHDNEAAEIAQRILKTLARPMHVGGNELYVTASIGVALFPRDGADGEILLSNADTAMYRAKALGRNQFQYWSEALNARLSERLALLGQLRGAVEREELRLFFQPQVSLPDGRISGVEALVRWEHPEFGMVSPAQFIPLAEESGLIEPIGEWVLFEACRQAVAWDDAGFSPLCMSVNLSARQFANSQLDRLVRATLDSTGLAPQRLELELTETAVMAEPEQSAERLALIRALGVRLALDDFGTGYSSLGYLRRFAFDRLKIDRSFVADAIHDPDDAAIVRTVVAMARMMGMQTVAEGAELAETVAWLGRHGCDDVQGYFVTPPLPSEDLERAFLSRPRVQEVAELFGEEERRTVLLLDDEDNVLNALQRILQRQGWRVLSTTDPQQAFALLARHAVQVVVSDQRMPGMSGAEFLGRVRELYPDTVRIVLSAYADMTSVTEAINRGSVYKYLTKPWDDVALISELSQAFARYEQKTLEINRHKEND